ncbi:hypothetical protein Rsub_07791 [Raphidocelis subcapitata]|uniref:SGNH hydrolase-type esterase domain-containing protein n=1 Tax=Raphidocelis subcapitata TaxID=307507 RepID=A0A2V0PBT7_9CHLO|nr:hypothetical protein Rsub_07791 [Raphidocelis subcapitata]|eukprot:GBF95363.1 hypothetical protein Rsub_07791 [Raphidocelis subcapitata]
MALRRPRGGARALTALLAASLLFTASAAPAYLQESRVVDGASAFKPQFVLLGDSITEMGSLEGGWQQLLTTDYIRRADIVNRGFSGYNSRWGLFLADEIVGSFGNGRADLVTVCFGANDAAGADSSVAYLSVPVEEYSANLRAIIAKLRSAGMPRILLLTPPPVDDANNRWPDGARSRVRAGQYADAAVAVAQELGVPHFNMWHGIQEVDSWRTELMHPDGLHLSRAGNKFVFDAVTALIRDHYPELQPLSLPLHFPAYNRINPKQPAETFNQLMGAPKERAQQQKLPQPVQQQQAQGQQQAAQGQQQQAQGQQAQQQAQGQQAQQAQQQQGQQQGQQPARVLTAPLPQSKSPQQPVHEAVRTG